MKKTRIVLSKISEALQKCQDTDEKYHIGILHIVSDLSDKSETISTNLQKF